MHDSQSIAYNDDTPPGALIHPLGDSKKEGVGFKSTLMGGVTNHYVQQALMPCGPLDTQVRKRRYVIIILGRTCPARGPLSPKGNTTHEDDPVLEPILEIKSFRQDALIAQSK